MTRTRSELGRTDFRVRHTVKPLLANGRPRDGMSQVADGMKRSVDEPPGAMTRLRRPTLAKLQAGRST